MLSMSRRMTRGFNRILLRDAREVFRDKAFFAMASTTRRQILTMHPHKILVASPSPTAEAVTHVSASSRDSFRPPRARGGKVSGALGLKAFMHRTRVLELYRGILKRAREIEDESVATEARRQFKESVDETDPLKIQMLLSDATNYLGALQGSARSGVGSGTAKGGAWIDIDDPEDKRGRVGVGFPWQD